MRAPLAAREMKTIATPQTGAVIIAIVITNAHRRTFVRTIILATVIIHAPLRTHVVMVMFAKEPILAVSTSAPVITHVIRILVVRTIIAGGTTHHVQRKIRPSRATFFITSIRGVKEKKRTAGNYTLRW